MRRANWEKNKHNRQTTASFAATEGCVSTTTDELILNMCPENTQRFSIYALAAAAAAVVVVVVVASVAAAVTAVDGIV